MKRATRWALAAGAVVALPLVAVGCGGSKSGGGSSTAATGEGKQGGTATFLWAADVDYVDPGRTFYTAGYNVLYATNRTLYYFLPSSGTEPVPDLADGPPTISADNKTRDRQAQEGRQVRPAGQPRGQGGRHQVRVRAGLLEERAEPVRKYLLRRNRGRPAG